MLSVCCILRSTMGLNARTTFTQEPLPEVFGNLGSDTIFHWTFSCADATDWNNFEEILWATLDKAHVKDKYITVFKNGSHATNYQLPPPLQSRLGVAINMSNYNYSLDFVLKKVTREDAKSTYGSRAVFRDGSRRLSKPITLVIRVPPNITRRSSSFVNVEEGEHVKLLCGATGDPPPRVEWKKNDKVLQSGKKTNNDLLIPNIELKLGGSYVCIAKNGGGSMSYSVLVRVVKYRPYINNSVTSMVLHSWLGHLTSLTCAVDANPAANFTWFKDGRLISSGLNSSHNVATVSFEPTKSDEFGSYLCKAENIKGTALHNVTVKQLFPPGPPVIKKLVPDMLSISMTWNKPRDDGGSIVLDYMITLLDANKTQRQMRNEITDSNYTIQNVKQNKTYMILIRARNVVGYGEPTNATVSTLEAARPVILHIATAPSVMSVNISWNSTNNHTGIKILDYRIILIDTITQEQRQFIRIRVKHLYVTRLKHNRTYVVKVQAENEDGYGRFMIRRFRTLEADPPGPPILKAFPRVFKMTVTWNSLPQDTFHIKILDYRIKVWEGSLLIQEHNAKSERSMVIKNLSRNKTYVIGIQARNEVGYGEIRNISARTLLAGPPDPPAITNITIQGNQCLVLWAKPYNGERPIEVYTVTVWIRQASNSSYHMEKLNTWNTTDTEYRLDLRWNLNYKVAVSAWNSFGQSFNGSPKTFTTKRLYKESSSTVASRTPTTNQVKTEEQGNKEAENKKTVFSHLVPLWIVVTTVALPTVLFVLWKTTKKILHIRKCKKEPPSKGTRQFHNRDSESSAKTLEEVNGNREPNHYQSITEIFEMNFNYGYNADDEKNLQDGNPLNLKSHQENKPYEYNHLHENNLEKRKTGQKKKQIELVKPTKVGESELESGLGTVPNHVYSHLIHGDSFMKKHCKWEISRSRLKLEKTIRCGQFGPVKKGFALNVDESGAWVPVAVQISNDQSDAIDLYRKDLLSELKMMEALTAHNHVIQLLACITESEPLCVITEFTPYGDLLGFLRKKRGLEDDYCNIERLALPKRSVTSHQLMQFAWEIADGMAHLSSAKIIHRDLAARNVLLGENLTCKITDFGMTRDIRVQDMFQKQSGGHIPIKWTALEALLDGVYTTKSDAWSFGVVLFEIATMGGVPYPNVEVLELIHRLASGYRMEKPSHVSDEVYDVMLSCWDEDPDSRPTFRQLQNIINQLDKEKKDCINLRKYNGKLYEEVQT